MKIDKFPSVFLACVLVYFPSAPPSPPSESAQKERIALIPSTRSLLANRSAWMLSLIVCLSQSVVGTWSAMMVTNLSKALSLSHSLSLSLYLSIYLSIYLSKYLSSSISLLI